MREIITVVTNKKEYMGLLDISNVNGVIDMPKHF